MKATIFCEISTNHLIVLVDVSQNFVVFSEYMNFNSLFQLICTPLNATFLQPVKESFYIIQLKLLKFQFEKNRISIRGSTCIVSAVTFVIFSCLFVVSTQ